MFQIDMNLADTIQPSTGREKSSYWGTWVPTQTGPTSNAFAPSVCGILLKKSVAIQFFPHSGVGIFLSKRIFFFFLYLLIRLCLCISCPGCHFLLLPLIFSLEQNGTFWASGEETQVLVVLLRSRGSGMVDQAVRPWSVCGGGG